MKDKLLQKDRNKNH